VADGSADERFLVLAPTGRDAPLTIALLKRAGVTCLACKTMDELCERLEREGAAGLLVGEEVLARRALGRLSACLNAQEAWSDIPVIVFTTKATSIEPREPNPKALLALGNVSLLERPVRPITMLSAVNAALRARRRQYIGRAELLAQQEAVRQRDQFLAMLGHELRNPLAAITLALRLEDGRQNGVMQRQVQHLTRLVDELLDVARVTSGKITLRSEVVDLVALARSCAATLAPALEAQQLALRVATSDGPVLVHGDPVRLEQVINNLLHNAAKYTPAGGGIELSVRSDEQGAVLEVQDSGVGISPDMIDRVFDLFAQAEGSLDRAKGGLGIGLTLVRNLIELHGGTISALSAGLDCGSTFRVRLPVASAAEDARLTPSEVRSIKMKAQPCQVLIVEDNADSRELLAMLLERQGHEVYAAEDGLSGVELAIDKRPDILLVDIGLPGLDGYGVAQQVRKALGRDVYLIALTGYGQPEDRRRALDAGFDDHYTKPLDVSAIDQLFDKAGRAQGVA
jgi:two-component system, sensor histidine kinase